MNLETVEQAIVAFSNFVWGTPLLVLLLGGGLFFVLYSRFLPFTYFNHAIGILRGKYDDKDDPGDINHYEALAGALAATIGVGNISGVAVAIVMGGPGAIFWMWVSAVVGMATKYFTCTLAIMYRGKDSKGVLQGGPMYVVREGLGKPWQALAVLFCVAGMIGCFPIFQANQLTQIVRDILLIPNGLTEVNAHQTTDLITGLFIVIIVGLVVIGGIQRIGKVAGKLVPFMVVLYVLSALTILLVNIQEVPSSFYLIVTDAFTGNAALGGAMGAVIIIGVKRAAFSNEAGIGTAPMMHGAAKTKEPVREGLVAMLGPFIDTIVVCTMTALLIISTGVWEAKISKEAKVELIIVSEAVEDKIQLDFSAKTQAEEKQTFKLTNKSYLNNLIAAQEDNKIIVNFFSNEDIIIRNNTSRKNIAINIKEKNEKGKWQLIITEKEANGVTLTANAFETGLPSGIGDTILLICIATFAITTLFSFSYYGGKCFSYLFGAENKRIYDFLYVGSIIFGAIASLDAAVSLIDGMYALMAIPTIVSSVALAPKVWKASKEYFEKMKNS